MKIRDQLRSLLESQQCPRDGDIIEELLHALSSGRAFPINRLMALNYSSLKLVLEFLQTWHLHQYSYSTAQDFLADSAAPNGA